MRPPILTWKVMLALLAVVIVGASVGSALRPAGRTASAGYGIGALIDRNGTLIAKGGGSTQVGGWTGYAPLNGRVKDIGSSYFPTTGSMTPQTLRKERRAACASVTTTFSQESKAVRRRLRRFIRSLCDKHR